MPCGQNNTSLGRWRERPCHIFEIAFLLGDEGPFSTYHISFVTPGEQFCHVTNENIFSNYLARFRLCVESNISSTPPDNISQTLQKITTLTISLQHFGRVEMVMCRFNNLVTSQRCCQNSAAFTTDNNFSVLWKCKHHLVGIVTNHGTWCDLWNIPAPSHTGPVVHRQIRKSSILGDFTSVVTRIYMLSKMTYQHLTKT